jgi:hypothetical protein
MNMEVITSSKENPDIQSAYFPQVLPEHDKTIGWKASNILK